jgi:hypothetical protein
MSSVPGFALRPVDERELLEISDRAVAVYGDVQSYQGVYGPEPTVLVCDGCLTIQDNNPVRFLEKVKLTL